METWILEANTRDTAVAICCAVKCKFFILKHIFIFGALLLLFND